MALSQTSLVWRGITVADGPLHLKKITGWEELPNISFDAAPAGNGFGSLVTPGRSDPRIVTATGWCNSAVDRDSLLLTLRTAAAPRIADLATEPLTIANAGLTLSADAQQISAAADSEGWAIGRFGFTLQWRCPDPLRYGDLTTAVTAIRVPTQGVSFPISGSWVFPDDPVGGVVQVRNPGNAIADARYTLSGPIRAPGVMVVETGARVTFDFDLADGDALTIDTAAGMCTLNGEYRPTTALSSLLCDMTLPAGMVATVQSLGTPQAGSPALSVQYRPAFW